MTTTDFSGRIVTLTRTADTNAYTANDVIGEATGSTAAIAFTVKGRAGQDVMITSTRLMIDASALISGEGSYSLAIYGVTPPSALGDNAAFDIPSGDRAAFARVIDLGTPVDEGSSLVVTQDIINTQVTLQEDGKLYAYLVTDAAYTPTSARVYRVELQTVLLP